MDSRDRVEQMMFRMKALRPEIPYWAKAERMEICTPQTELWKYAAAGHADGQTEETSEKAVPYSKENIP